MLRKDDFNLSLPSDNTRVYNPDVERIQRGDIPVEEDQRFWGGGSSGGGGAGSEWGDKPVRNAGKKKRKIFINFEDLRGLNPGLPETNIDANADFVEPTEDDSVWMRLNRRKEREFYRNHGMSRRDARRQTRREARLIRRNPIEGMRQVINNRNELDRQSGYLLSALFPYRFMNRPKFEEMPESLESAPLPISDPTKNVDRDFYKNAYMSMLKTRL